MWGAMPLTPFTPRDRLQQLVHLGRKTWRHGWLIAVFAGGGQGAPRPARAAHGPAPSVIAAERRLEAAREQLRLAEALVPAIAAA